VSPGTTGLDSVVCFEDFELDLKNGHLRRNSAPVKLSWQPLKILLSLAAHPRQLQTRDDMRHLLWEGETFVDFDLGLNYCLNQIRKALGDNARNPHYIETVPRRGYRFIAPVCEDDKIAPSPGVPSMPCCSLRALAQMSATRCLATD
jgi:DNA-binding winged helix-turn-helix (wHTH) protein